MGFKLYRSRLFSFIIENNDHDICFVHEATKLESIEDGLENLFYFFAIGV